MTARSQGLKTLIFCAILARRVRAGGASVVSSSRKCKVFAFALPRTLGPGRRRRRLLPSLAFHTLRLAAVRRVCSMMPVATDTLRLSTPLGSSRRALHLDHLRHARRTLVRNPRPSFPITNTVGRSTATSVTSTASLSAAAPGRPIPLRAPRQDRCMAPAEYTVSVSIAPLDALTQPATAARNSSRTPPRRRCRGSARCVTPRRSSGVHHLVQREPQGGAPTVPSGETVHGRRRQRRRVEHHAVVRADPRRAATHEHVQIVFGDGLESSPRFAAAARGRSEAASNRLGPTRDERRDDERRARLSRD